MRLAALTTLRLGGPAERLVEAHTEDELVAAVRARPGARAGRRLERRDRRRGRARARSCSCARAGSSATATRLVVAGRASRGTSVVALLRRRRACRASSACPGSPARPARRRSRTSAPTGRTSPRPSQWVRVYDRETDARRDDGRRRPAGSSYRRSVFKYRDRWTVLAVAFRLRAVRAVRAAPLRRARARARRPGRRPRAAGRRARGRARPAPRQGHGDRPRRSRLGQRRLVLHQPDPEPEDVFARSRARRRRSRSPTGAIKTSAAWLIERAGLRARVRRRTGRDLDQAHARARQPRRRDDRRADGARARDRRRRARDVRHRADARAGAGRPPLVSAATCAPLSAVLA